jgi:hypothetical protein
VHDAPRVLAEGGVQRVDGLLGERVDGSQSGGGGHGATLTG